MHFVRLYHIQTVHIGIKYMFCIEVQFSFKQELKFSKILQIIYLIQVNHFLSCINCEVVEHVPIFKYLGILIDETKKLIKYQLKLIYSVRFVPK